MRTLTTGTPVAANPVLATARSYFDPSDRWGWCGAWGIAMAAVLWELSGGDVPDAWGYHPGRGVDHPIDLEMHEDFEIISSLRLSYEDGRFVGPQSELDAAAQTLTQAGNIIHRYSAQCQLAGVAY